MMQYIYLSARAAVGLACTSTVYKPTDGAGYLIWGQSEATEPSKSYHL